MDLEVGCAGGSAQGAMGCAGDSAQGLRAGYAKARCSLSAFSCQHLCGKRKMIVNFYDVINQSYLSFTKVM